MKPVEFHLPCLWHGVAYERLQVRQTGGRMAWLGERLPRVAHCVLDVERQLALICRA